MRIFVYLEYLNSLTPDLTIRPRLCSVALLFTGMNYVTTFHNCVTVIVEK